MDDSERLRTSHDLAHAAIEAIKPVSKEYGFPASELRPCIAILLDGNIAGAPRHSCAFAISTECRRVGLQPEQANQIIRLWSEKISYTETGALRAVKSAYAKKPNGEWRYHPPGLKKSQAYYFLQPTCEAVGCPANCPRYSKRRRSSQLGEDYLRFQALGWETYIRKLKTGRLTQTYRAICERERTIEWIPGDSFYFTHEQIAELAGLSRPTIAAHLPKLQKLGLIHSYEPGSGLPGQPHQASICGRVVPIPQVPYTAITSRVSTDAYIEQVSDQNQEDTSSTPIYRGGQECQDESTLDEALQDEAFVCALFLDRIVGRIEDA